jgi:hypothetical protein
MFAKRELEFCGYIISNGFIRPIPAKIEVIKTWLKPMNVHEVRQFLGLATYYHQFVHEFIRIAAPLYKLLKELDALFYKKKFHSIVWNA